MIQSRTLDFGVISTTLCLGIISKPTELHRLLPCYEQALVLHFIPCVRRFRSVLSRFELCNPVCLKLVASAGPDQRPPYRSASRLRSGQRGGTTRACQHHRPPLPSKSAHCRQQGPMVTRASSAATGLRSRPSLSRALPERRPPPIGVPRRILAPAPFGCAAHGPPRGVGAAEPCWRRAPPGAALAQPVGARAAAARVRARAAAHAKRGTVDAPCCCRPRTCCGGRAAFRVAAHPVQRLPTGASTPRLRSPVVPGRPPPADARRAPLPLVPPCAWRGS